MAYSLLGEGTPLLTEIEEGSNPSMPASFKDAYCKHFKSFCNKNLKGDGILYILKFTNLKTNQEFLKIGITSKSIEERYPKYLYKNYKYESLYIIKSDAEFIFKAEQSIHKRFFDFKLKVNKDFQGYSECYNLDLPISEVIDSIL